METTAELYERVKWIFKVIAKLWREQYSGTLTLTFYKGVMSPNYKREIMEKAPDV